MKTKLVTYTIPKDLDAVLQSKVGRKNMNKFVTGALWNALNENEALLMEVLAADKDPGNLEVKNDFATLEGEDFDLAK